MGQVTTFIQVICNHTPTDQPISPKSDIKAQTCETSAGLMPVDAGTEDIQFIDLL